MSDFDIEFVDSDDEPESFADSEFPISDAETAQDIRDRASRVRVEMKEDEFRMEQADLASGRIAKHGPGEARAKTAAGNDRSKANTQYQLAASAAAYAQPITLNLGGQNVNMTLGDLRDAASDRYNHFAKQVRDLKAQGASSDKIRAAQQRMRAYGDLMTMTDLVAAGKMSPTELQAYIDDKKIGDDLLETVKQSRIEYHEEKTAELEENADELKQMSDDDLFASLAMGDLPSGPQLSTNTAPDLPKAPVAPIIPT